MNSLCLGVNPLVPSTGQKSFSESQVVVRTGGGRFFFFFFIVVVGQLTERS